MGVKLAESFGRAIREGRIEKRDHYTQQQASAYVRGALGGADPSIMAEFAVAHNINNDDLGRVEIEACHVELLHVESERKS